MGKHSTESKRKFKKRKRKENRQKEKQHKKASIEKNHICLCNASSRPDKTSISWLSSSTSTTSSSSSVKPKDNHNFITFTSDPLYVRLMEYSVLKKTELQLLNKERILWKCNSTPSSGMKIPYLNLTIITSYLYSCAKREVLDCFTL